MGLFRRGAVILTAVVGLGATLSIATASRVHAQGSNPGNPSIAAALEQIQATLTTLQSSVNALLSPVASTVRFTPGSSVALTDLVDCVAVNVTSVTRNVQIQLMNRHGVAVLGGTLSLEAGNAGGFGDGLQTSAYCKFTVLDSDGSRTDIRGSMTISSNAGRSVVPAE